MISGYNSREPQQFRYIIRMIAMRIMMKGFLYGDYVPRIGEFYQGMGELIASGKVQSRDTVYDGLDSAADAFLGLFTGANTGKMLVRV
jgi:NADPH-dependent curcumin reductase CurA